MKIVFFGTPEFSLASFEACLKDAQVLAAVTQPDRARGRGQKLSPCPVKELAQKNNLPNFSPASLRKDSPELDATLKFLHDSKADLFVVVAYGNILPQEVLSIPRLGCVNVHASLLPRWRGAAPIQRALEHGDKVTGVSLQKMVMEMDAGDVVLEKTMELNSTIQAQELSDTLSKMGGELIAELLGALKKDSSKLPAAKKQNAAAITLAPKISKEEGYWKQSWSPEQAHNKVRAFSVWPGVRLWAQLGSGPATEIKVLKTRLAGHFLSTSMGADVRVTKEAVYWAGSALNSTQVIEIIEIQLPSKAPMQALSYFHSQKITSFSLSDPST